MRQSRCAADLDLDEAVVTISRGVVMGPSGFVEKDTKALQARRVARSGDGPDAGRSPGRRGGACSGMWYEAGQQRACFSADVEARTPWYPDSVSRRFRRSCKRIGLEGVRLHDLRHYVATRLLSAGVGVRTVAGRLGHRNAATTLNVYSHFVPETDRMQPHHCRSRNELEPERSDARDALGVATDGEEQ